MRIGIDTTLRTAGLLLATGLSAVGLSAQQSLRIEHNREVIDGYEVSTTDVVADTVRLAISPQNGSLVVIDGQTIGFRPSVLRGVSVTIQAFEVPEILDGSEVTPPMLGRRLGAHQTRWVDGAEGRSCSQGDVGVDNLGLTVASSLWAARSSFLRFEQYETEPQPAAYALTEWYLEVLGSVVVVQIRSDAARHEAVVEAIYRALEDGALILSEDIVALPVGELTPEQQAAIEAGLPPPGFEAPEH